MLSMLNPGSSCIFAITVCTIARYLSYSLATRLFKLTAVYCATSSLRSSLTLYSSGRSRIPSNTQATKRCWASLRKYWSDISLYRASPISTHSGLNLNRISSTRCCNWIPRWALLFLTTLDTGLNCSSQRTSP